jgi:hypothetical protein
MPSLSDLRHHDRHTYTVDLPVTTSESLVHDVRSRMSPTQMVEQKLRRALCVEDRTGTIADRFRRLPR